MATIAENLQSLVTAKNDIATAITNKGIVLPENAGFGNFASAIDSIETGVQIITGNVSAGSSSLNLIRGSAAQIGKHIYLYAIGKATNRYVWVGTPLMTVSGLNLPNNTDGIENISGLDLAMLRNNNDEVDDMAYGYASFEWDNWVHDLSLSNCNVQIKNNILSIAPNARGSYTKYNYTLNEYIYADITLK